MMRHILALLCALMIFVGTQLQAQTIPGLPATTSTEQEPTSNGVKIIIIDEQGKITVADDASALSQTDPSPASKDDAMGSRMMEGQKTLMRTRELFVEQIKGLPVAWQEVVYVLRASSPDGTIYLFFWVAMMCAVLLLLGSIVEIQIFGKRIAKHYVVSRIQENPEGYLEKLPFLVVRFIVGVIGALVTMATAYLIGLWMYGQAEDTALQFTITMIFGAYLFFRTVTLVWRMVLSPFLPQYRIPALNDRDAKRLFYWLWVGAFIGIFTNMTAQWVQQLGLNQSIYLLMQTITTLVLAVFNVLLILVNRRAISGAIRGRKPVEEVSAVIRWVSYLWVPVALLYILFAIMRMLVNMAQGIDVSVPLINAAYSSIMTAVVVYGLLNYVIERIANRSEMVRRANKAAEEARLVGRDNANPENQDITEDPDIPHHYPDSRKMHSFADLGRRVAGIIAFVGAIWTCLSFWGVDLADDVAYGSIGDIISIAFIGYIIYQAFRIWIDSKIAEEQPDTEAELGDEGGGGSASRLGTLLPLFRNIILVVIVIAIALIMLMELGVNVSPLFAGAGIVGIAVGFGAQSLVRDIFSGAFFLIDDAFRKGEYIDVGDVKGTVENISVRSFQLRHHLGALHTIPFGEIKSLTNYSRDWVIMKLKLRLTYDTDVERVRKLVKKLGVELMDDPEIGQNFLQPLKSQGVIEMQDSAMIVRVKFMTKPGDQWLVRKKVFQEIRELFEREGVKFANREVTVHIADGRDPDSPPLTEAQKKQAAAAALDMDAEGMPDLNAGGDDR